MTNNEAQNVDSNGVIKTGQGFIVEVKDVVAPTILFNNTMSMNTNANHIKSLKPLVEDYNRVWLNPTKAEAVFYKTTISYFSNGSDDLNSSDDRYLYIVLFF